MVAEEVQSNGGDDRDVTLLLLTWSRQYVLGKTGCAISGSPKISMPKFCSKGKAWQFVKTVISLTIVCTNIRGAELDGYT